MKALLLAIAFFTSIICFAQSPVPTVQNLPDCDVCPQMFPTSISQVKDVNSSDKFYKSLQNLIERFAVDLVFCKSGNFEPKNTFTNAMWAQLMNSGLERMNEVIASQFADDSTQEKALNILSSLSYDKYEHNYTSTSQIKDVKETDCYYLSVESLTERYGMDITSKNGLLNPNAPVNVADICELLKKCWNLKKFNPNNYPKNMITKADFVMLFSDALDEYSALVFSY